ncbi:MAG: hypothetical protein PVH40_05730, partial [Gemmatimonadales bacterium]
MRGISRAAGMGAIGLLLTIAGPAAAQEPQAVTLDEAIRRALMVNPTMVRARGQVTNAAASKRTAIGNW